MLFETFYRAAIKYTQSKNMLHEEYTKRILLVQHIYLKSPDFKFNCSVT